MEYLAEFSIERDENGKSYINCADEETAELLEGAFIDWYHRGYVELVAITEGGRVSWRLTPWGKKHAGDIIKVRNEE